MSGQVSVRHEGALRAETAAKSALVTGITGQDGSYLAEFLLAKGYAVHGLIRRPSALSAPWGGAAPENPLTAPPPRAVLHYGDLSDANRLAGLVDRVKPDEIYHLGAQSDVGASFEVPEHTGAITGLGTTRLLEAVRQTGLPIRFYQASSSEMFGSSPPPQCEATPFQPLSPYAAAKAYAYWMTRNYRDAYSLFAVNGILFNHESPRRGINFVTRKIAAAAARIAKGEQDCLYLGNLDARRDWGYAPEYVEAMWKMLQLDEPDDYVIATGTSYSVQDFVQFCFEHVGLNWRRHLRHDPRHLRPADVPNLVGDASKASRRLDWKPGVFAPELARIMTEAELHRG
jgi:GDPmannose 4,6-dehydratase